MVDANTDTLEVVGEGPCQRIEDLLHWCRQFAEEVEWWFTLCGREGNICYLKKPVCIELYEFAHFLQWAHNEIRRAVREINGAYKANEESMRLDEPSGFEKQAVEHWKRTLEKPRDQVAAHRYTDKSGASFVTVATVSQRWAALGWDQLELARDRLLAANSALQAWIEDPVNRSHLPLVGHSSWSGNS